MNDYNNHPNPPREGYGRQPAQPGMPSGGADPFAAWRGPAQQSPDTSFLTDSPAPLGAELQQGGSPLFSQQDFGAMGDNAPTRVGSVVPTVTRRTTVTPAQPPQGGEPFAVSATAYPQDPPRRRRRSASPAADETPSPAQQPVQNTQPVRPVQPVQPAQNAPVPDPEYDLFSAGDGEAQPLARRTAVAGERYTGARTAMPTTGASVAERAQMAKERARSAVEDPMGYDEPARQTARPRPRPAQQDGRRPAPQQGMQRQPMREEEYAPYEGRPVRSPYDDPRTRRPSATVQRERYDFEDERDEPSGGILLPLVVVLLVIGALLAGICLPKWDQVDGTFGSTMNNLKTSVVTVFANVKDMVLPADEPIKSFNVSTADSAAPADVRFTVQTAKNIEGIRIEDDKGFTIYSKLFSDQLVFSGEVINNSDEYIWTPTCRVEEAYTGGFTVFAQKSDGTETEGVYASGTVDIAAPKAVMPPIQDFTVDGDLAVLPAAVTFHVLTSADVSSVRVENQYGSVVLNRSLEDARAAGQVITEGETLRWTIPYTASEAYAGEYFISYQTGSDLQNYITSGFKVQVEIGPAPTATPLPAPVTTDAPAEEPTEAPTATPTQEPTATPTEAPTPTPSPSPTPDPTATPAPTATPEPTPVPTPTLLPALAAAAGESASPDSGETVLKTTVYNDGKSTDSYTRSRKVEMLAPFSSTEDAASNYAVWKQAGVLTFRNGPMRQNAAYGTVEVSSGNLTELWSHEVGGMKVNSGAVYGVVAPGQPLIVKWPTSLRASMGIKEEMQEVKALKEVIVAGQDGKIYFFNLLDGQLTREPFDLGAPSAGGLSIATNGTPVLGVGQSHSRLASKTVKSGYHLINLLNNKEIKLIQTDNKERTSNYSGVLGAALFDNVTGTMIFGSQGGLLYTAELGTQKEVYKYEEKEVQLQSGVQMYKGTTKGQDKKGNIDGSVAMYGSYAYYGDEYGVLQCVDVNTMSPVWSLNLGDNIDATPALDLENGTDLALYTGTTIYNQRKNGSCVLSRINALTGDVVWSYTVPECKYQTDYDLGLEASPVVGQEFMDDLVIFTVACGESGSQVIALHKDDGSVAWQTPLPTNAVSSPVAVYNEGGDSWIIQAEVNGTINLLDGIDGSVLSSVKVDGQIEASPAVYGNLLVIGTTGRDKGGVYCFRIE